MAKNNTRRKNKNVRKQNTKKTRHMKSKNVTKRKQRKQRKQRGGGWMGEAISAKDSTTVNMLLKSKYYRPSKEDNELFNINNIPESIRKLNTYLASRIHVGSKSSKPGQVPKRGTGITVTGAKLSLCTKILAAELPHSLCITFSYVVKFGSYQFYMYRQIGPLNYFMDEDLSTLELPFIMLLNLFEQRYDTKSMDSLYEYDYQYTKEELETHRISLLIKDMTEEKYETLTVITPEEYTRRVDAAKEAITRKAAAKEAAAREAAAREAAAREAAAKEAAAREAAALAEPTRESPAPPSGNRFQVSTFTPNY